jgi:hypothetical protein
MSNLSDYYQNISFNSTKRVKGKVIDFYNFDLRLSNWREDLEKKKENKPKKVAQNTNNRTR